MEVKFTTQYVLDNKNIVYNYADDILHVTMTFNGEVYEDSFDFSDFTEDGELRMFNGLGERTIQTSLPENPIISAERVDGVLRLGLLEWIAPEPEKELEEVVDNGED